MTPQTPTNAALADALDDITPLADGESTIYTAQYKQEKDALLEAARRLRALPDPAPSATQAERAFKNGLPGDEIRSALVKVTGSLGLVMSGANPQAVGHKENYEEAKRVLAASWPSEYNHFNEPATPPSQDARAIPPDVGAVVAQLREIPSTPVSFGITPIALAEMHSRAADLITRLAAEVSKNKP